MRGETLHEWRHRGLLVHQIGHTRGRHPILHGFVPDKCRGIHLTVLEALFEVLAGYGTELLIAFCVVPLGHGVPFRFDLLIPNYR